MANFPCCVHSDCQDPSNPIANFTAEGPDPNIFIGINYGGGVNNPPNLGWDFTSTGCVGTCLSTVSQSAADLCAQSQQILCSSTQNEGGGGGGGGGGFKPPGNKPPTLFGSAATHCDILCPDGSTFRFSVPANEFQAYSQAYADAVAQSIACLQAQSERMCMNDIQKFACVNQFYGDIIETQGGTVPIIYTIVSGSLPPGFSFVQQDDFSVDVEGTCPTPGNYTFSVRATDRFGIFMVKTFTIAVIGFTNTPSTATQGSAYNFTFSVAGGTGPYTFSLASGTLPTGLTLNSSGSITGTPTGSGVSTFTVQVTDSTNASCSFSESINVGSTCNCKITDWVANPGNCRLRLTAASYHDGILLPCLNATPSALPGWDGTLPLFSGGQYLSVFNAPTTLSVSGHKFFGCNLNFNGTNWSLGIAGDSNGISNGMWIGPNNSICPIGNYTFLLGCQAQPVLTLTLEAYVP